MRARWQSIGHVTGPGGCRGAAASLLHRATDSPPAKRGRPSVRAKSAAPRSAQQRVGGEASTSGGSDYDCTRPSTALPVQAAARPSLDEAQVRVCGYAQRARVACAYLVRWQYRVPELAARMQSLAAQLRTTRAECQRLGEEKRRAELALVVQQQQQHQHQPPPQQQSGQQRGSEQPRTSPARQRAVRSAAPAARAAAALRRQESRGGTAWLQGAGAPARARALTRLLDCARRGAAEQEAAQLRQAAREGAARVHLLEEETERMRRQLELEREAGEEREVRALCGRAAAGR